MIVYLGMPRCASSWLYDNLKHIETGELVKEPHTLYTDPNNLDEYCANRVLDFSTNNWSMDSSVAKSIDPYVSDYVLVVRNPVDLAVSYKSLFVTQQPLDDFVSTMIINKLLCFGDIVERWYNLVDANKIHIYSYEELQSNNLKFIDSITKKLKITADLTNLDKKINVSKTKEYAAISETNLIILQQQIDKLEKITNQSFNIAINNLL
jgi:hypothetical protein